MSRVEIDQSGRMEMSGETVVAVANELTITVRITARVKQQVRTALRKRGIKPRMVMIRMFVGAIVLALRRYEGAAMPLLWIDKEYTGYEAIIKSLLLDRGRRIGLALAKDDIVFTRIGKKSPAHRAAIRVLRHQAPADETPSAAELLVVC